MPDVLPTEPALAQAGAVSGAGDTIPGTVRVPSQTALGTGTAIGLTLVQPHLGHTQQRTHIQHLLGRNTSIGILAFTEEQLGAQTHGFPGTLPCPRSLPEFPGFIHKDVHRPPIADPVVGCGWARVVQDLLSKTRFQASLLMAFALCPTSLLD